MEVVNHFKEGREHYRKGDWDKAIKSFKECLKLHPEDKLSNTYVEWCEAYKKNPPKNWEGVRVATSK